MNKIILLIPVFIFLVIPIFSTQVHATWWDSSWDNKASINISTISGTTPQNYSVPVNVTYDSDMNADFSDLRFTNASENTALDYWIQDKVDSTWAYVWIEIAENITTTNQVMAYMYYKNSGASTTSNISYTFIFGDDFNRANSTTIGNNWEQNTISGNITSNVMYVLGGSGSWNVFHSFTPISNSASMGWTQKGSGNNARWVSGSKNVYASGGDSFTLQYGGGVFRTTPFWTTVFDGDDNVLYRIESRMNSTRENFTINGTLYNNNYAISTGTQTTFPNISFGNENSAVGLIDDVYVRYYQTPEPTYSIGSEESGGTPYPDISVALNEPANSYSTSTAPSTILFNATATTKVNANITNCSLWLNSTGTWLLNLTNSSQVVNDTKYTFTQTLSQGVYLWNVQCYINDTHNKFATLNRTITVQQNYYIYENFTNIVNGELNNIWISEADVGSGITSITLFVYTPKNNNYNYTIADFRNNSGNWTLPFYETWVSGNHTVNGTVNGHNLAPTWFNITWKGFNDKIFYSDTSNWTYFVNNFTGGTNWWWATENAQNWNEAKWLQMAQNMSKANYTGITSHINSVGVGMPSQNYSYYNGINYTQSANTMFANNSTIWTPIMRNLRENGQTWGLGVAYAMYPQSYGFTNNCPQTTGDANYGQFVSYLRNLSWEEVWNYVPDIFLSDWECAGGADKQANYEWIYANVTTAFNNKYGTNIRFITMPTSGITPNSMGSKLVGTNPWNYANPISTGDMTTAKSYGIYWGFGISTMNSATIANGIVNVNAEQACANIQMIANSEANMIWMNAPPYWDKNITNFYLPCLNKYSTAIMHHGYTVDGDKTDITIWAYYENNKTNITTATANLNWTGNNQLYSLTYNVTDGLYKQSVPYYNNTIYTIEVYNQSQVYRKGWAIIVDYEPLGEDTTSPTFSNMGSNVTNNTAVNTGTPINISAQWNDNVALSMYVNANKTNTSGSWVNRTWNSFTTGNWSNFTIIFPSEQGSNITLRIYANDSSDNQNVTGTWYWWNVSKASVPLVLENNTSLSVNYPTATNITGSGCISGITCNLYRNNVGVSNPDLQLLGAGSHVYIFNTSGNANVSSNTTTNNLVISQGTPSLNVSFNTSDTVPTNTPVNVTCDYPIELSVNLYNNTANVGNPYVFTTSSLGDINFTCNTTGDANYTTVSTSHVLSVTMLGRLIIHQILDEKTLAPLTFNLTIYNATFSSTNNNIASYDNNTVRGDLILAISADGYVQRNYYVDIPESGLPTNITGYLLKSTDGVYVTYWAYSATNPLGEYDSYHVFKRFIGSGYVTVSESKADIEGKGTVYLDPYTTYVIGSETSDGLLTYNISSYNPNPSFILKINFGGGGSTGTNTTWLFSGTSYSLTPTDIYLRPNNISNTTAYNFTLRTNNSDIQWFSLRLIYWNGTVLYSSNTTIEVNGSSILVNLNYTNLNGTVIAETCLKKIGYDATCFNRTYIVWMSIDAIPDALNYLKSGSGLPVVVLSLISLFCSLGIAMISNRFIRTGSGIIYLAVLTIFAVYDFFSVGFLIGLYLLEIGIMMYREVW